MTTKTIKQNLTIHYEITYDPDNDWYSVDDETLEIDHSQEVTTSKEIAETLLNTIIGYAEKMAMGNIQDIGCEEVEPLQETIVCEVKEKLGLDADGDLPDEYETLVRSVLISTSLSERTTS
jgi:hypothetical protein